jgi:HTH-type transcriptional regulator/antitoxin HipB
MLQTIDISTPGELGAALRAARRARGLRLEDAALAAGVGVRFLSELERGKPTVRLAETLRAVASLALRLVIEDLEDTRPASSRESLDRLQAELMRLHGESDLPSEADLTEHMRAEGE